MAYLLQGQAGKSDFSRVNFVYELHICYMISEV